MALTDLSLYALILEAIRVSDHACSRLKECREYDLADQLSRAALSVSNNFAEAYGRSSSGERLMFMFYADGSAQECMNCLRVAAARRCIESEYADSLIKRYGRISIGIIEFCASILDRDPDYNGAYRERVKRRRAWRTRGR